jgi:hypothetical protein
VHLRDVERWVDRYVVAWTTNDPTDIGALFTADARYFATPSSDPWIGRDEIVARWIEIGDTPGTWTFRHEPLAVAGDLGFARGWTTYRDDPPGGFDNLFILRLSDDARCSEFAEWYQKRDWRSNDAPG